MNLVNGLSHSRKTAYIFKVTRISTDFWLA